MAIIDDFSVSVGGDIRYTGVSGINYTVIDFHRWLGDLMDDAQASGNDILDITDATASERSTDNIITLNSPFNIDDTAAQHLYDGSIIQSGGNAIYDGILVFAAPGTYLDIIQNSGIATPNYWTTGLNANAAAGISHRFMLKVRTGGNDIDGRRLIGQTREFGYTYSEFKINGTSRGNNVLALTYATDLNNTTASGVVATWNEITNTEGYRAIDVNNDTTPEYYFSEWNKTPYTINQFYERMKYITCRGSTTTVYGMSGQILRGITHELDVNTPTGTFAATGSATWSGGAGRMLAINHATTPTKMWIQLLTGAAPTNSQTITVGAATCVMNGSPTERALSFPWCGASTGSALIGSYGFGIEALDLASTDKVFDLTNTQRNPPNYATFTVAGLVNQQDRVLVGPGSGNALQTNQFALASGLTGAVETTVKVQALIPSDTPAAGTVRVKLNSGIYRRIPYTSYANSVFTISGLSFVSDNATAGNDVYISYVDTLASGTSASFTSVYSTDRSLFIRVRDGGVTPIKTFETTGTLGSAGGSATAIRTSDL